MPVVSSSLLTADYTQDDIEASPESVMGATFEQAKSDLVGPSILRSLELNALANPGARGGGQYVKKYSADDASKYMTDAGLEGQFTFDREYNQNELKELADRKRAELKRQSILSRADRSKSAVAGRFGLQLATSFLDPLTVATAFVPVVGEVKYAKLLSQAGGVWGRAGVRARVGAIEGAVGSALVEPIIAGAKWQEQADYTMADSLLNIAVGTVLGGGLHVTGGAIGDALTPASRTVDITRRIEETAPQIDPAELQLLSRMDAARAELSAADIEARRVSGELLDREALRLQADVSPAALALEGRWSQLETDLTAVRGSVDRMGTATAKLYEPGALQAEIDRVSGDPTYMAYLRKRFNAGDVSEHIERRAKQIIKAQRKEAESQLDALRKELADVQRDTDVARKANAAQARLDQIERARKAGDVEALLEALPQDVEPRIRDRMNEAKRAATDFLNSDQVKALELKRAAGQVAAATPDIREAALKSAVAQAVTGQPIETRPVFDRSTFKEAAARLSDPDQRPMSNPEAVKRADDVIRAGDPLEDAALDKQIQELDAQLKAMESDAELSGDADLAEIVATMRDEFKEADAAVRESSAHAQMLTVCASRSAA